MSIIRNGILSADLDVPVVLPTLNLDFANSQSLDSRITFSRGSIGTRVNRNGLIETIPANQPRFDFDPISGECRGLLIEETRTNLITSSNSFGGGTADYGVTANVTTSPDGTTNASLIYEKTTNNFKIHSVGFTAVIGTTYCASAFVKYAGSKLYGRLKSGSTNTIIINLTNGAILLSTGTCGVIPYPNGWYRIYSIFTATSTSESLQLFLQSYNGSTSQYPGDGSSGYYVYGMQVEQGAFPTSYYPTTSGTGTRFADNAEMTGTNFSSWYNQSEGTFFYNGTLPFITNDTVARVPFGVSGGFNFSNSIYVAKSPTTLELSFTAINNNVAQISGSLLPNMTSSKIKIASSVAPNNIYSCGYGGVVNKSSRTSAAIPTATRLTLGKEPWNVSALNPIIGCISKFAYYPKALSPSQLQYLTQ
jgi:hypothetical protein